MRRGRVLPPTRFLIAATQTSRPRRLCISPTFHPLTKFSFLSQLENAGNDGRMREPQGDLFLLLLLAMPFFYVFVGYSKETRKDSVPQIRP